MPTNSHAIDTKRANIKLPDDMHERARRLKLACASAAAIAQAKQEAGMARSKPAPWPESTWKLLAEHARYHAK